MSTPWSLLSPDDQFRCRALNITATASLCTRACVAGAPDLLLMTAALSQIAAGNLRECPSGGVTCFCQMNSGAHPTARNLIGISRPFMRHNVSWLLSRVLRLGVRSIL